MLLHVLQMHTDNSDEVKQDENTKMIQSRATEVHELGKPKQKSGAKRDAARTMELSKHNYLVSG